MDDYEDRPDWGDESFGSRRRMFRDPGGKSALRAASKRNPRNLPCPTCKEPNRLTPADRAAGYQCDSCADRAEGGF
jgi:hypothetical protein